MKISVRYSLFALLLLISCTGVKAQHTENETTVVEPLRQTTLHPLLVDIWLYGAGSYKTHSKLWTASNYSTGAKSVYDSFVDLGVEADIHRNGLLSFGGSLGYKYERYAYDSGLFSSDGVRSHWLSTSLNVSYWFFNGGILSDIYLGSSVKSNDYLRYEGLNGDCFNRASLGAFGGFFAKFTRVKFEARVGFYFKTQLNPDKIAHYNLQKTQVSGFFWELKASYRLFTSGKHYNGSNMID